MQENLYSYELSQENENNSLDFRPYGLIVGKDITQKEVDDLIERQIRSIKDHPPTLQNEILFGNKIHSTLSVEELQTKIIYVLNNLKDYYNGLATNDKLENQLEELKNGFGRYNFRINMLDEVHIEEKNPFYWVVNLKHELPTRPDDISDTTYSSLYLNDTRLYGKLLVMIYQT